MKYIDAENLKVEIKKRYDEMLNRAKIVANNAEYWSGKADSYRSIYVLITSLQQEQFDIIDSICTKAGIPAPYKDGNQWSILKGDNIQEGVVGFGDTKMDALVNFIKDIPIQQEQPEVELAEEAEKEYYKYAHYKSGSISGEGYHLEVQGRYECNLTRDEFKKIARHFYELGLNAGKK